MAVYDGKAASQDTRAGGLGLMERLKKLALHRCRNGVREQKSERTAVQMQESPDSKSLGSLLLRMHHRRPMP